MKLLRQLPDTMKCNLVSCQDMVLQMPFHLATVTGVKLSQKVGFLFRFRKFGKGF